VRCARRRHDSIDEGGTVACAQTFQGEPAAKPQSEKDVQAVLFGEPRPQPLASAKRVCRGRAVPFPVRAWFQRHAAPEATASEHSRLSGEGEAPDAGREREGLRGLRLPSWGLRTWQEASFVPRPSRRGSAHPRGGTMGCLRGGSLPRLEQGLDPRPRKLKQHPPAAPLPEPTSFREAATVSRQVL